MNILPRRSFFVRAGRSLAALPLVKIAGRSAPAEASAVADNAPLDELAISPDGGRSYMLVAVGPAASGDWAGLEAEGRWSWRRELAGGRALAWRHAHRSEIELGSPQPTPLTVELRAWPLHSDEASLIRTWREGDPARCTLCHHCNAFKHEKGHTMCTAVVPAALAEAEAALYSDREGRSS